MLHQRDTSRRPKVCRRATHRMRVPSLRMSALFKLLHRVVRTTKARVRYVCCEEPDVGKVAVGRVAMIRVVGVSDVEL